MELLGTNTNESAELLDVQCNGCNTASQKKLDEKKRETPADAHVHAM